LAAVMAKVVVPVTVGVPDKRAVPLALATKVNPAGRAYLSDGRSGRPVVVTATAPDEPAVK